MEGPRPVAPQEMPLLARLVDTVFMQGREGAMFDAFPTLFDEGNRERLLVFSEDGTPVSHVGMVRRWASLMGCTVRVGLVGSVATYAEHRGKGYARRLFRAACDQAAADGVDFLMISGDRPLYLAAGATFVGRDREASLTGAAAATLADPRIALEPLEERHVPLCAAAYAAHPSRYVRTRDDWRAFLASENREGARRGHVIRYGGAFAGYIVDQPVQDGAARRVEEWAGDALAVAGALPALMALRNADRLTVHLQQSDALPAALLANAGAPVVPVATSGTCLPLRFSPWMDRLRPWFEACLGAGDGARLETAEEDGRYVFRLGTEQHAVEGKAALARLVFGHPDDPDPPGFLGRLFPLPALWYGLNFI